MNKNLISIIVPMHNNSQESIRRLSRSINRQSLTQLEVVLIDDASEISLINNIDIFFNPYIKIVKYRFKENMGAGAARAKGIELASGFLIAMHDSDDFWKKDKLKKQVEEMKEFKSDIVTTDHIRINANGKKFIKTPSLSKGCFKIKNPVVNSSAVIKAEVAKKELYPLIRRRQDYAYWAMLANKKYNFHNVKEYLVYYDASKNDTLSRKWYVKNIYYNFLAHRFAGQNFVFSIFFVIANVLERVFRR